MNAIMHSHKEEKDMLRYLICLITAAFRMLMQTFAEFILGENLLAGEYGYHIYIGESARYSSSEDLPEGYDILYISRSGLKEAYRRYLNETACYFGNLRSVSTDFEEISVHELTNAIRDDLYLGGAVEDRVQKRLCLSEEDLDRTSESQLAEMVYRLGESSIPFYYVRHFGSGRCRSNVIDFPFPAMERAALG
jgi:hypothetical protein